MLNFVKSNKCIAQYMETKTKVIDLKMERIQILNFHCIAYTFSLCTPLFNMENANLSRNFRVFFLNKQKNYCFFYLKETKI